jgi:stage III sporulation protein AA
VDERSEIAAMCAGQAQLQVGPNTDVLDGCCKEVGLRWMLRSMAPEVLVTDELGSAADVQAVLDAAAAGVCMLSTLHGRSLQPAPARGLLSHILLHSAFERYVLLDAAGVGQVAAVYDERLQLVELP